MVSPWPGGRCTPCTRGEHGDCLGWDQFCGCDCGLPRTYDQETPMTEPDPDVSQHDEDDDPLAQTGEPADAPGDLGRPEDTRPEDDEDLL